MPGRGPARPGAAQAWPSAAHGHPSVLAVTPVILFFTESKNSSSKKFYNILKILRQISKILIIQKWKFQKSKNKDFNWKFSKIKIFEKFRFSKKLNWNPCFSIFRFLKIFWFCFALEKKWPNFLLDQNFLIRSFLKVATTERVLIVFCRFLSKSTV